MTMREFLEKSEDIRIKARKIKPENFFFFVQKEYSEARRKYPPFHSTHEGIAVIQEEVDELWEMVKKNKGRLIKDGNPAMVKECIQIAAMAYAFVKDLSIGEIC